VARLVLFHHDPYHTDDELQSLNDDACRLWGDDGKECVSSAWEGMSIDVGAQGITVDAVPLAIA
jgi:hypothetical protein